MPFFINGFRHEQWDDKPLSYYGEPLPDLDALVPRIGPALTGDGIEIIKGFEARNVHCLASSKAIAACRDQEKFYACMQRAGLLIPKTMVATPNVDPAQLISAVGGPPLVIKLSETSRGEGVILAQTFEEGVAFIRDLQALDAAFVVQEFIESAGGSDIRCIVLRGHLLAAAGRHAKTGDFRTNLYQGGSVHPITLPNETQLLSIQAAQKMKLEFAGVDIIRSGGKSYLLEVNASPGIQAFNHETQAAIIDNILNHFAKMPLTRLRQTI